MNEEKIYTYENDFSVTVNDKAIEEALDLEIECLTNDNWDTGVETVNCTFDIPCVTRF